MGIEEWLLPKTHHTVPLPLPFIVIRGRMEDGPIIPDGEVILSPAEADLQVMVVGDELEEVCLQDVGFSGCDVVNVSGLDLVTSAEEGLPTCDGVRSDDRTAKGAPTDFSFIHLFLSPTAAGICERKDTECVRDTEGEG